MLEASVLAGVYLHPLVWKVDFVWAVGPPFCSVLVLEGLVGRSIVQGEAISELLAPALAARSYSLVRTRLTAAGRRTLQVMVERLDGRSMTVSDCADVSGVISVLLDSRKLIEGSYQLEITSPGIDRPLMNAEDFKRYMGYAASVTLNTAKEGQRKIQGLIVGVADNGIEIEPEGKREKLTVCFSNIGDAKLLLTDALIKAAGDANR
ncbi:MAG: ribosome maturation factor RimP [Rhodospirillaceae bacterium]|nr:ribosome maturation factor RimP [Rhodospirillaceae bacterium]